MRSSTGYQYYPHLHFQKNFIDSHVHTKKMDFFSDSAEQIVS